MDTFLKTKDVEVKAERFQAGVLPWPQGVGELPDGQGFYFSDVDRGAVTIMDGDWVVADEYGRRFVLPDGDFKKLFTVKP